jgi:hypothetical protein
MNELIFSCTDDLAQASTPTCGTDYGERVVKIIFSKTKVSTSGNVPTASDFNASYSSLSIFESIVNGHRTFLGETEIEWHHKEWFDKMYTVTGKIRRVNDSVQRAAEKISRYSNLYFYFITEKNYCFGPYYSQPSFNLVQFEGKGTPYYLDFKVEYVGSGIDYSNYDEDYDSLYDSSTGSYLLTEDDFIIETEDGSLLIQE